MLLSIQGFRAIKEYECEIQPESITLLSGPSGIGKSTLFNAIYWCLYGSLKNVRKFGSKTGTCKVQIVIRTSSDTVVPHEEDKEEQEDKGEREDKEEQGIKIIRSKGPDCLSFEEIGKIMLKDDEAQEKINQLFGTQDIWLSSCYLRQGTRNKFLESSPSDRLTFLSELCFSTQTSESYLEKIEEKCKAVSKEFERQNDFYKRDLETFQKKRKLNPQYKSDLLSEEQKKQFHSFLESKIISHLENQLSFSERTESSILSLTETKSKWINALPEYSRYLLSDEHKNLLQNIVNQPIESPKKELGHLDEEIQQYEKNLFQIEIWKEEFEQKSKQFNQQSSDIPETYYSSREEIQTQKDKIKKMEQDLDDWMKKNLENQNKKGQYQIYQERLNHFNNQLATLSSDDWEGKYYEIQDKLEKSKIHHHKLAQKSELEKVVQMCVIQNDTIPSRKVEPEEIKLSIAQETQISQRNKDLYHLGVQTDKDSVQKAIQIRKKICDVQNLWDILIELQSLEEEINHWDEKINKLGKRKDWISEQDITKRILEIESNKDTLQCPKCSTAVRYEQNRLVECHQISKEKIEALVHLVEISKNRMDWMKEKQSKEDILNEKFSFFQTQCDKMNMSQDEVYQFPKLEQEEKQKLWIEIQTLENYLPTFEQDFESSELLEKIQQKWEMIQTLEQIQQLELEIDQEYLLNLDESENQKEEAKNNWRNKKDWIQEISDLHGKLSALDWKEEMKKDQLDELKKEYEIQKQHLNLCLEATDICILKNKLEKEKEWKDSLNRLKNQRDEKSQDIEQKRKEFEEAKQSLSLCVEAERIQDLNEKIEQLNQNMSRSSMDIRKELEETKEQSNQMKSKLILCEKSEEIAKEKSILEKQRSDLISLSNRLSTLSKLKMIGNELEHKRMLTILETINDFTNEMLTILFDEPIKIEFSVYKTTKSKDKVKPSIVYKILHKGFELDHVDQLSGGEGDRVSLALTCALFQFTKFPYLLLDEFASSLDLNTKEMAIQTLKTFLGIGMNQHKSIVCISHDTVEGIYDQTIKL